MARFPRATALSDVAKLDPTSHVRWPPSVETDQAFDGHYRLFRTDHARSRAKTVGLSALLRASSTRLPPIIPASPPVVRRSEDVKLGLGPPHLPLQSRSLGPPAHLPSAPRSPNQLALTTCFPCACAGGRCVTVEGCGGAAKLNVVSIFVCTPAMPPCHAMPGQARLRYQPPCHSTCSLALPQLRPSMSSASTLDPGTCPSEFDGPQGAHDRPSLMSILLYPIGARISREQAPSLRAGVCGLPPRKQVTLTCPHPALCSLHVDSIMAKPVHDGVVTSCSRSVGVRQPALRVYSPPPEGALSLASSRGSLESNMDAFHSTRQAATPPPCVLTMASAECIPSGCRNRS